jgi:surfactin family lipopeptide synthetase A
MNDLTKRLAALSPEKRELVLKKLREQQQLIPKDKPAPSIVPVSREEPIPLSSAQEQLWFLSQLEGGNAAYNMSAALRFSGHLRPEALEHSLNAIIARHEILRTTFVVENGRPVQKIAPTLKLMLPVTEIQAAPESTQTAEIDKLALEDAQQPFDLANGPLLRAMLLRAGPTEHVLVLTMHHIISDGWSLGLFLQEMMPLYQAAVQQESAALPTLPVQYADFAHWQQKWLQSEAARQQLAYWRQQLAGEVPVLELPADHPRPSQQTFRGATQTFTLPVETLNALKTLSQQEGATVFTVLLTVFKTLLYRYTGQDDLIVGTPVATRQHPEIQRLIGYFVNPLVLRTDCSGNPTFRALLRRVRTVMTATQTHQDFPFERLVAELHPDRKAGRQPLIQVMFVSQNAPTQTWQLPDVTVTPTRIHNGTAKLDLALEIGEIPEGLNGVFEYNTDLFEAATVERMSSHFQRLVESIVADPDQHIADLPLLAETERRQLLVDWNRTAAAYPDDQGIHHLFETQAARTPDALALWFEHQQITYRQLNSRANQVAHYLQKLGVKPDALVGICVRRSPEMIVGVLGVLKAGGAYMPLDPAYPRDRLAFMLDDSGAPVLLTQTSVRPQLPDYPGQIVDLDADWNVLAQEPQTNPTDVAVTPDHLAYMIYTSGSTGKPKGVLVPHRGLCNLVAAQIPIFDVRPDSRVLQFVSFSFDVAASDIFMTLCAGATLCLAPRETLLPGPELVQLLRDRAITHIEIPAPVLAALPETELPALRSLITGGEKCAPEVVVRWSAGRRLFNAYGPTEATVCSTIAECRDTNQLPPIGRPIANITTYILDRRLQPAPVGVPGELHIGGVGVARGYLNRPDLTQERFIPDPFGSDDPPGRLYKTGDLARYRPDGAIEFLGRVDHQVKIRGFRVELQEIETVLQTHPAVQDAVVIMREDQPGNKQLAAYLTSAQPAEPDVNDLRQFVKQRLPDYMVPAAFMVLESLPLTPNGKVDRRALPAPEPALRAETAYVKPQTETEAAIAAVWQDVLGLDRVGIHENFFEIGGHSLLVVQVHSRLEQVLAAELSVVDLFQYPTIHALAQYLGQQNAPSSAEAAQNRGQRRTARDGVVKQRRRIRQQHRKQ